MMDPHTGSQLSTDEIVSLCDELKKRTKMLAIQFFSKIAS